MSNYPFIRYSRKFFNKFDVVIDDKNYIPCYNLATARSILKRLSNENWLL